MIQSRQMDADSPAATILNDFVAIDLETTGLDPASNEIIELGAVRFNNGREVGRFRQFVKPTIARLPVEITRLTGITNRDLKGAPLLASVAEKFIEFTGDLPLVGHHVAFDLGFLAAAPGLSGWFHPRRVSRISHDTSPLARFLHPALESYSLASLTTLHRCPTRSCHRAAEDAAATGELFLMLLDKLARVAQHQLVLAYGLVEGTPSPFANTLRTLLEEATGWRDATADSPDPFWSSSGGRNNVYISSGQASKPATPVEGALVKRLFSIRERFEPVLPRYEERPQQAEMSAEVSDAIAGGKALIVEAGTGVGKSLAYLVPLLLSGRKCTVATHTRHLQEQLFYSEVPRVGTLLKFPFKAVLLKGRRNYLCRTKWQRMIDDPGGFSANWRERLAVMVRWVDATQTGDLSELTAVRGDRDETDGFIGKLASEPGYCGGRSCQHKERECPLVRVRNQALTADLLIVNHSLVMADLLSELGLFEAFPVMVFDEAHHLEDAATDQLTTDLYQQVCNATLERIGQLCRRNGEFWNLILAGRHYERQHRALERVQGALSELTGLTDRIFQTARQSVPLPLPGALYSSAYRYEPGDPVQQALSSNAGSAASAMQVVSGELQQLAREFLEGTSDRSLTPQVEQELTSASREAAELAMALTISLTAADPNRVHWIDVPPESRDPVRIKSAPLDVAPMLAQNIFERLQSVIFTSATLSTSNGPDAFTHLSRRLGLDRLPSERLLSAQFGSPFDFDKNCLILYPTFVPSPQDDREGHTDLVSSLLAETAIATHRAILALFTSYRAMRDVERRLKRELLGTEIELLVQWGRADRDRLLQRFRKTRGGILLGTDSLWEGVDLPGEALEMVIVAKLPFDVPADPVVAARIDQIRSEGRSPFQEYQLPMAILRTRQGVGRLIRSSTDRGVVLFLDPRITTKEYGRRIRSALPGRSAMPQNREELISIVSEFFDSSKDRKGGD